MRVPVSGKGKDNVPIRPPWQVRLSYEYELRKEAVKLAWQNNRPSAETLIEVTKNAELKEQFFTTPIALQHFSQSSSGYNERELAPGSWEPQKWHKGKYKGKGKFGKDKARETARSRERARTTSPSTPSSATHPMTVRFASLSMCRDAMVLASVSTFAASEVVARLTRSGSTLLTSPWMTTRRRPPTDSTLMCYIFLPDPLAKATLGAI